MKKFRKDNKGFSLIELIIAMTLTLILLGLVSTLFARSLGTREREGRKADALTAAQAALSVMSREIGNSGYGLTSNGIVWEDSSASQIHFRTNVVNADLSTNSPGEDITYFFDAATESIVRFDPNDSPTTSAIINRISSVSYQYFDYQGNISTPTESTTPSNNTGRVRITITVQLDEVQGQPTGQTVSFTSDVTLRNSNYMLNQY
jgi:prepilin-type N-terminal cleavage/methylation domain-containing protein